MEKILMRKRLIKLLKTGWVTPLDALRGAGCLSLSQRCGEFIREGLPVHKRWVCLDGKRVMSYRIQ